MHETDSSDLNPGRMITRFCSFDHGSLATTRAATSMRKPGSPERDGRVSGAIPSTTIPFFAGRECATTEGYHMGASGRSSGALMILNRK